MIVVFWLFSFMNFLIECVTFGSRPVIGSSRKTTFGLLMKHWAIEISFASP